MGFDAHLTVSYLDELTPKDEHIIQEILNKEIGHIHSAVLRDSIDMFGPNNDIPVLKVIPGPDLWALHKYIDSIYPSPSEYPWNPHITLDLKSNDVIRLPKVIRLIDFDLY